MQNKVKEKKKKTKLITHAMQDIISENLLCSNTDKIHLDNQLTKQ